MDRHTWQKLLSLESQEVVKSIFQKIHGKSLNTRRAKEICSSAKQSREFFRNVNNASFSVRPLLAFYGVSSLSRSLTLLMRSEGGEEGLNSAHGLSAEGWSSELSGDINVVLKNIGKLKVKTTSGLFTDFLRETDNTMCFHVSSSAVDWRINYNKPPAECFFTFSELLARIPDLSYEFKQLPDSPFYAAINELTYSTDKGFNCKVISNQFSPLRDWFEKNGYSLIENDKFVNISCDAENFESKKPQFIHTYLHKTFQSIPSLFLSKSFENNFNLSQLAVTYISSYYLGMLARYFPTQWTQLINGGASDNYWPILNNLQLYVEKAFPELVIELVNELIKD